jgi:hypothetical protein
VGDRVEPVEPSLEHLKIRLDLKRMFRPVPRVEQLVDLHIEQSTRAEGQNDCAGASRDQLGDGAFEVLWQYRVNLFHSLGTVRPIQLFLETLTSSRTTQDLLARVDSGRLVKIIVTRNLRMSHLCRNYPRYP